MRFSRSVSGLFAVAVLVPCWSALWANSPQGVAIGTRIRVASANLDNLWDGNPTNSGGGAERASTPSFETASFSSRSLLYREFDPAFSNWYTPEILNKKVDHMLQSVRWMGVPDILAAQEIESAGNASEVLSLPYLEGGVKSTLGKEMKKLGYAYFYLGQQESGKPVSVTQAIWSKFPLTEEKTVRVYFPESLSSSRDIQVMRAKVADAEFLIFNGHWKSKNGGGEDMRRKTALAMRARIDAEEAKNPNLGILAVGDFNSDYYEEPMITLGTSGDIPTMLKGDTPLLYNLWMQLPIENRWEFSFNGVGGTLSQMLISKHFFSGSLRYVDHSFQVIGQEFKPKENGLLAGDGIPYAWQAQHEKEHVEFVGEGYSDHLPLVMDLLVVASREAQNYEKSRRTLVAPTKLRFDKVPLCKDGVDEILNLEDLSIATLKDHVGDCVQLQVPEDQPGLPFSTHGKYQSVYVNAQLQDGILELGVAMTRRWDPRPNVDAKGVDRSLVERDLHSVYPSNGTGHSRSNKCFQRKVLQKAGGELRYAMGRIGYYVEGYPSILVATREKKDLILENLPSKKAKACPWDDTDKENKDPNVLSNVDGGRPPAVF